MGEDDKLIEQPKHLVQIIEGRIIALGNDISQRKITDAQIAQLEALLQVDDQAYEYGTTSVEGYVATVLDDGHDPKKVERALAQVFAVAAPTQWEVAYSDFASRTSEIARQTRHVFDFLFEKLPYRRDSLLYDGGIYNRKKQDTVHFSLRYTKLKLWFGYSFEFRIRVVQDHMHDVVFMKNKGLFGEKETFKGRISGERTSLDEFIDEFFYLSYDGDKYYQEIIVRLPEFLEHKYKGISNQIDGFNQ